jgi:hypothetical protein
MAVSTYGLAAQGIGAVPGQQDVEALCSGAATLSREGNRIAALALLWAAVAVEPTDFVAHRRLAAALTNAGDLDAAAEEYARFIEFMLKQDDVRRAAGELAYARAFLGEMPQLRSAATYPVALADVVRALDGPAQTRASLPMPSVHSVATWTHSDLNGAPAKAPPTSTETLRSNRPHKRSRWHSGWARWTSSLWPSDFFLIVSLVAAATIAVTIAVGAAGRLR